MPADEQLDFAVLALTEERHFASFAFAGNNNQIVTGGRHTDKPWISTGIEGPAEVT